MVLSGGRNIFLNGAFKCFNCVNSFTPRHYEKEGCGLSVMWSDGPNLCRSEWSSGELWVPSNMDERLNFPPVISWGDSSFLRCLCCIINGKQSFLQNYLHVLHGSLLGSHVIQLHCLTNHCISQLLDNLRLQINLFH